MSSFKPFWWCHNCDAEIGGYSVTYEERHDLCQGDVEWVDTAERMEQLFPEEKHSGDELKLSQEELEAGDASSSAWLAKKGLKPRVRDAQAAQAALRKRFPES